ncbi:septum formation initiator family protein [Modestobacter sp. I12A-02628]|uniref:Septum formation initiator family protein n=1 Tax=Goekera deserti TaxID=2497753 RepID=A0A7K3WGT5_9ACTN|nr:septum formation initiator family protein [Goekera deserti]MPQ99451.1 septum formation initiator family protein [Goekera deserti]NDI48938.1 septum formation initiator family protein [Goekera deserti]NEL55592.1 septum formation initiator family protein [Goekera deserti]
MSAVRGRRGGPAAEARGRRTSGARPARSAGPSREASRPGQRRSSRYTANAGRGGAVAHRPLITGRAVLLVALVLLLALTLAGPLRQYVAGRQDLAELAAEGSALDRRAEELQEQLTRQADPAYTRQQAQSRLAYVLPGDRLVVVADGETVPGATEADAATPATAPDRTWYEGLLESVATADGDAAEPTP